MTESLGLLHSPVVDGKWTKLAVPRRRCWSGFVVRKYRGEVANLACAHVGRAASNPAKRWGPESALRLVARDRHEPQFGAVFRLRVAVVAEAIERVVENHLRTENASPVFRRSRGGGHTGIVEVIVGQQRAIVAVDALTLADEQPKDGDLRDRLNRMHAHHAFQLTLAVGGDVAIRTDKGVTPGPDILIAPDVLHAASATFSWRKQGFRSGQSCSGAG